METINDNSSTKDKNDSNCPIIPSFVLSLVSADSFRNSAQDSLYISTSIWVLRTPNAGQNSKIPFFAKFCTKCVTFLNIFWAF